MPEHIWSVLCHKGLVDSYTNTVSLLDVIESITLKGVELPPPNAENVAIALPNPMTIVSLWMRRQLDTPEIFATRLVIQSPAGERFFVGQELASSLQEHARLRTFMRFDALPLKGPGLYRFLVEIQRQGDAWETVAALPLDMQIETTPSEKRVTGEHARAKA